ncbi:GNAT family protein [Paenibacillus sp. UMB7766-LJ446]|uniref:GNAT family N-acetyltransferase n=1 Tax=Paenibacillus sp. UMB7766-LJ446 TaxID=3046313 RepID=UPI0033130385
MWIPGKLLNQGKGYASLAMKFLPLFVLNLFPQIDEIILTVNKDNLPAKRLYEKSGFVYKGKTKLGRSGVEFVLHYLTRNAERLN